MVGGPGAGKLTDGRTVMWNAVVGLNDTLPHIENTLWIDGDQPFGTFAGTLPGGLELSEGYGVVEDHRAALW